MEGEAALVMSNAEIDTTSPFRSVKEAVVLFGERVLCTEVYAKEIQEHGNGSVTSDDTDDEVEAIKQSLLSLQQQLRQTKTELQQTKTELQQLKTRESDHQRQHAWDLDSSTEEDIKFIEEVAKTQTNNIGHDKETEFQKNKCVRFANHPTIIAQVIVPKEEAVLQRHPSLRKKKKMKQIIPLIRRFFTNKSGRSHVAFA